MIEINLLPEELKTKTQKINIKSQYLLYFIPLLFAILIFVHVYLAALGIVKNYQFSVLNNKWKKLQPQREILKNLSKEYEVLSANAKVIQQLNIRRLNWSEKLNKLSLNLPSGIWFNEISLSRKDFILEGSVISLQKEEMNLVNKFIDNLKRDSGFFKDFNNLELSSVQIKTIGGYDILDFILTGKLNPVRNTGSIEMQNKISNGVKSR